MTNLMKCTKSVSFNVAALAVVFGFAGINSSFSDSGGLSIPQQQQHEHKKGKDRGGFRMGVCVGQKLAEQGIRLPAPQPGQVPSHDPVIRAAFKAAIQGCRAEIQPAKPQSTEASVGDSA